MKKSKVLGVLMSSALVVSVAAASSMSASAISNLSQIKDHFVGVTGTFNNWEPTDVELTDADGDGIYEGIVSVDEVTENMFVDWSVDDVVQDGKYFQFKVRLDKSWDDSWGAYEPENNRTYNSQSNVRVLEAEVGKPLQFKVIFDTTKIDEGYINNKNQEDVLPDDPVAYDNIGVKYEFIPSETQPSQPTESSKDTTTVPTGDATSAAALAAIVVASLGVAVVMTKKASAK